MFKKFSTSFFKKITLLALLIFSVLLMAMNIPTPFGGGDKPSSFKINQQSLQTAPVVKTPQAVWTFLQSQDLFEEDWKEDYTNWLDLIQKRKPQKTLGSETASAVIDLRPLWNVDLTTTYSNLSSEVKKVLSDLSQFTDKALNTINYKNIIQDALKVSFQKETQGATHDLINTLKVNDRWTDLIKYQIRKIKDVNIISLWDVKNIASLSGDANTYNTFSKSVKVSFRNLLDLELDAIESFQSVYSPLAFFDSKDNYEYILTVLGTSIDDVIKKVKEDGEKLWDFLKVNNRLTNIKQRKIPQIANVDISSLHAADSTTSYENLNTDIKGTFYDLLQVQNYELHITNDITSDANIKTFWNTFLTQNNRFTNLQIYQINIINGINLVPLLENITTSTSYHVLTFEQRMILKKISGFQSNINSEIRTRYSSTVDAWLFIKEHGKNRLANLKQYQISTIDTIQLLPLFKSVVSRRTYRELTNPQITKLYLLSQRPEYQKKVDDAIRVAHTATSNAWTFLQTSDRLKNLKKHKINKIGDVELSPLFQNVAPTTEYANLSPDQKTTLYLLSQTLNYKQIIISEINKKIKPQPKSKPTPAQPKNISLPDVWKFLQTNNRLKQLQTNQILKTSKFDLSLLAKIKPNTKYEALTDEQTTALYNLSQLENYQDIVTKTIANSPKPKIKDSDNLLWLWITLPLFLVSLIFGFGFYFYRFKKLSNQKQKN